MSFSTESLLAHGEQILQWLADSQPKQQFRNHDGDTWKDAPRIPLWSPDCMYRELPPTLWVNTYILAGRTHVLAYGTERGAELAAGDCTTSAAISIAVKYEVAS